MKIAVLGFGRQGISSYNYFLKQNADITIHDINKSLELPEGAKSFLGEDYLKNLNQYDLILRSPKIHPREIVENNSEDILEKVSSNTNEFFKVCPSNNIIGVTGTKGKGTTSTLIFEMLKNAGFNVHLGGNIGISPLDLLDEDIKPSDYVVLELANFQTIDLKFSPHIGVCLLVEPEHLDWHEDMDEYISAKAQMFKNQNEHDIAVYYSQNENSKNVVSSGKAKLIPYFKEPGALIKDDIIQIEDVKISHKSDVKLLGEHNLQNVCAALTAVWQIEKDAVNYRKVIETFTNLPFRLELRKTVNGVKYFNDSFSSNLTASKAALDAIKEPKILILGGKDRGLELKDLLSSIESHKNDIKNIIVIGEASGRIVDSLNTSGFNNYTNLGLTNMQNIIDETLKISKEGDAVVLSPGFPSFDMFKDFEDRGKQFNSIVDKL